MAKVKNNWKTKQVDGETMMICQNSNLELSKYPDWSRDNGEEPCDVWSKVGNDTTAVLCSECTSRSLVV